MTKDCFTIIKDRDDVHGSTNIKLLTGHSLESLGYGIYDIAYSDRVDIWMALNVSLMNMYTHTYTSL